MFGLSRLFCRPSPLFGAEAIRFKATKSGGSTSNGRNSAGRRLGLKKNGGQPVISGNIIIRQRGLKYRPGENIGVGRDHTLWALTDGWVHFTDEVFNRKMRKVCNVVQFDPNKLAVMRHAQQLIKNEERAVLQARRND